MVWPSHGTRMAEGKTAGQDWQFAFTRNIYVTEWPFMC